MSTIRGTLTYHDGDDNENVKKAIDWISKTTTLHVHHAFLYIFLPSLCHYDVIIPNFAFYGGPKQPTPKFAFSFWTWIWLVRILLKKSSLAFDKVNEVGVVGIELKEHKFTYFKRRFRGRRCRGIFNSLLSSLKQKTAHIYFINTSIQKLKGLSCIGGSIFFVFQIKPFLFQKRTDSAAQKSGCGLHFAKGTHP